MHLSFYIYCTRSHLTMIVAGVLCLILCLIAFSSDNRFKQFGPRSDPTMDLHFSKKKKLIYPGSAGQELTLKAPI